MRSFENRAQLDHFVTISGTPILLSELKRIWNGEEFLPQLTEDEFKSDRAIWATNQNMLSDITLGDTGLPPIVSELVNPAMVYMKKKGKYKKIKNAIEAFQASSLERNESLNRALAKLQNHPVNRDEIGYELATDTKETELTEDEVEIIVASINEVNDLTDGKSNKLARPVTPVTAAPIHALIEEQRSMMEQELDINLPEIPIAVLERALYQQGMDKDELYELSLLNNIGNDKIIDVINTARYLMFLGGLMGMGAVFLFPYSFSAEDLNQAFFVATSGAALITLYPSGTRRPKVKMSSSISKYKKLFDELQGNVEKLSSTNLGKIKVAFFKEIVASANTLVSSSLASKPMQTFITQLESDPKRLAFFESWAQGENIENFNDPMEIVFMIRSFLEVEKLSQSPEIMEKEEAVVEPVMATVDKTT